MPNMETIRLNLKKESDSSYGIFIDNGLFNSIALDLKNKPLAGSYVVITDSNVAKLYGKRLLDDFRLENLRAYLIAFPAGEQSKNRKTKEKIEDEMLKLALGRDTCIIALGGGVVGDIAGFVAATYMRGIPYIQVPTTLLAMADSSIGGKVAVDAKNAKNAIGAFYQPKKAVIDLNFLKTLPKKELIDGLAEVIKHALIMDNDFFQFLEKNVDKVFVSNTKTLSFTIKRSCEIKAEIVMQDEKEKGMRKILNYGHTIGHAIESAMNYRISHGSAIAIGMSYAAKLSARMGFLEQGSAIRQNNLLEYVGLPHKISHHKLKTKKILECIRHDKKILNEKINFVLLNSIGDAFISDDVDLDDIKQIMKE